MKSKADCDAEFGDVQVTDLDAKHRNLARSDSIPHAEFMDTPGPKVKRDSSDISSQATVDGRDPPSTPGHSNCSPRVSGIALPKSDSQGSDQAMKSHPPSPITAVATPVATPNGTHPPKLKLQTQERTARHSRGRPLHQEINNIFSSRAPSILCESPSSESSLSGMEE